MDTAITKQATSPWLHPDLVLTCKYDPDAGTHLWRQDYDVEALVAAGSVRFRFSDYMTWNHEIVIECIAYPIARKTPCGVWLTTGCSSERFVLDGGGIRFAYPCIKQAWHSFYCRKRKAVGYATSAMERALLGNRAVADVELPKNIAVG